MNSEVYEALAWPLGVLFAAIAVFAATQCGIFIHSQIVMWRLMRDGRKPPPVPPPPPLPIPPDTPITIRRPRRLTANRPLTKASAAE